METKCSICGDELEVGSWPFCWSRTNPGGHGTIHRQPAAVHASEAVVLFEHPVTGKTAFPGRNDAPMPKRYVDAGYQRKTYQSLADVRRIEKREKVVSEVGNYNRGSGYEG